MAVIAEITFVLKGCKVMVLGKKQQSMAVYVHTVQKYKVVAQAQSDQIPTFTDASLCDVYSASAALSLHLQEEYFGRTNSFRVTATSV